MCPPLFAALGALGGVGAGAGAAAGAGVAAAGAGASFSTFAALAGAGLSAFGAIQQGDAQAAALKAQQEQYNAQASLQDRQANLEQIQGSYEARRKQEQLTELTARQRGQFAASGVTIEGSPSDVILDTVTEGSLDIEASRFATDLQTDNARFGASMSRINGASAGRAAKTAATTGFLNALTPLIAVGANDKFVTRLGGAF